jgi:CubicO group peptidase (beta-lactamase class C family)
VDYYLPSFKGTLFGGFTIFELMTHTAPIPGTLGLFHRAHTKEEMLEILRTSSIRQDPPGSVLYTCEAFMLMGEIISAVDSASLDEVIRRRVLEKLGMKNTCYKPPSSLIDRIAPTEYCSIRDRLVRGEVHDENAWVMGGVSGNAGIFSCAPDMARLGVAMLGSLENGAFLRKAVAELMCRNHTPGMDENRGLGWMVASPGSSAGDLLSPASFGHTGFTGTSIWIDPDRKFYAVLLTNRVHFKRENTKLFRTRNIFHNLAVLEYIDS